MALTVRQLHRPGEVFSHKYSKMRHALVISAKEPLRNAEVSGKIIFPLRQQARQAVCMRMLILYPTGGKRTCISEARASHRGFPRWSFGQSEISMIRLAKSLLQICRAPSQGSRRACSSMVLKHDSPASQRVH